MHTLCSMQSKMDAYNSNCKLLSFSPYISKVHFSFLPSLSCFHCHIPDGNRTKVMDIRLGLSDCVDYTYLPLGTDSSHYADDLSLCKTWEPMLMQPTFPWALIHHAMKGSELKQNPEIHLSGLQKVSYSKHLIMKEFNLRKTLKAIYLIIYSRKPSWTSHREKYWIEFQVCSLIHSQQFISSFCEIRLHVSANQGNYPSFQHIFLHISRQAYITSWYFYIYSFCEIFFTLSVE